MDGEINDIADCIESIALTESLIVKSTNLLQLGVERAASILADVPLGIRERIAQLLSQPEGEQTHRMAIAIIANAMVYHKQIEGQNEIPLLSSLKGEISGLLSMKVVDCWNWIISTVNYFPIFEISAQLLDAIPSVQADLIVNDLHSTAHELSALGATELDDLSGRMFQKLIADRKFLATFCTLPVSATFLAELAVRRLNVDWSETNAVTSLRVGDLACGTGTLIGALYRQLISRYRRAGNDSRDIHAQMLEESVYALDIMPAATHLTASTLSSAHPDIPFANTQIATMPYGKQNSSPPVIGSLELLQDEQVASLFSLGRKRLAGRGQSGAQQSSPSTDAGLELVFSTESTRDINIPHEFFDVLIMNPPYTRPTNHELTDVPIPSFAGFGNSEEEQNLMSSRLQSLRQSLDEPAGHGNAGLASNFLDLGHIKLKPGGILALVLPATFASGKSWPASEQSSKFQFINLSDRPANQAGAIWLARAIAECDRSVSSGNIGVSQASNSGSFIHTQRYESGCVGLNDPNIARFMLALAEGKLVAHQSQKTASIPMTAMQSFGTRGLLSRDLTGPLPRGPFDRIAAPPGRIPLYPCLWSHDAQSERQFTVLPDSELIIRPGQDEKAVDIWERMSSKLHLNVNFRLNSQSLAACVSPTNALGGDAWPNFVLNDEKYEKIMMLWFNSAIGLMCYWWIGTRQQPGRTRVSLSQLSNLNVMDFRESSEAILDRTDRVYESFERKRLLPANESYRDKHRQALDHALIVNVLGFPNDFATQFDLVRRQWCAEPSVHGGKSTKLQV